MPTYVAVPAAKIEDFLQNKGFERSVYYNEVVYTRSHDEDANVKIKIYTSIRVGQTVVRGNGQDSIKIAAIFDDGRKRFGIGKFPHVLRVGSEQEVLDRMYERMVAAYKRGSEWLAQQDRPMVNGALSPADQPRFRPIDEGPRGGVMTEEEFARLVTKS